MSQERVHDHQPRQFVHRFFGGPPLAVIGRLVLLSILVGVILAAIALMFARLPTSFLPD